jgi:conjugal transfer pilus assembly protein TraF
MKPILPLFLLFQTSLGDYYFSIHESGWHWYKKDEEVTSKFAEESPLERLRRYQQELETTRARAVMDPTPENVEAYQKLQYEMLERSHRFANVWMQNVYKNSSLDYSLKSPTSQNARRVYLAEEQQKKEEKITAMAKNYGLFFFFKNNCPYCRAFAPLVKKFSEKYRWEVLAIGEFGEKLEEFPRNVRDSGLAETWGVSIYPSLFAVNPKTGDVAPVAQGMISIEEMEDRIASLYQGEKP